MNTSKVIHQAKLNSWADSIREQQSSSLSVSKWCELNQISKTQFYYWKRQLADTNRQIEMLAEQLRIMNQRHFGKHSEVASKIKGY